MRRGEDPAELRLTVRVTMELEVGRGRAESIDTRRPSETMVRWYRRWLRRHGLVAVNGPIGAPVRISVSEDGGDLFIRNRVMYRLEGWAR